MITETRTTSVYIITHEELVDAFLKWSVKASEESWETPEGPHEAIAAESAATLVEFLNQ